jgi:hypothetical protein
MRRFELKRRVGSGQTTNRRRGATALTVLIVLPVLFGMAALAIDVGFIYNLRAQMQNAVDSGALAGASALPDNETEGEARGVEYATKHHVGKEVLLPEETEAVVGYWEHITRAFYPASSMDEDVYPNAVRVVGRKEGIGLFFARIFGIGATEVAREAVALSDSGRCRGIWGLVNTFGSGTIETDSYDSRLGPYGAGNMDQNGDICCNEDVAFNGSVTIRGDVMCGPGYTVDIGGGSGEIWGVVSQLPHQLEPPVVDPSEARFDNNNDTITLTDLGNDPWQGGGIRLSSDDNLALEPGTYYFEYVNMTGQSTITVTGPTMIYVDGDGKFGGGGIVNVTHDPANLMIYGTGEELKLAGGSGFYGAVVAPDSDLELVGTAEYFGTLIARTIDMAGTSIIHVDEAVVDDLFGNGDANTPTLVR